jgi:hypothetical protein
MAAVEAALEDISAKAAALETAVLPKTGAVHRATTVKCRRVVNPLLVHALGSLPHPCLPVLQHRAWAEPVQAHWSAYSTKCDNQLF